MTLSRFILHILSLFLSLDSMSIWDLEYLGPFFMLDCTRDKLKYSNCLSSSSHLIIWFDFSQNLVLLVFHTHGSGPNVRSISSHSALKWILYFCFFWFYSIECEQCLTMNWAISPASITHTHTHHPLHGGWHTFLISHIHRYQISHTHSSANKNLIIYSMLSR